MKKYQRSTPQELDSILLRINMVKEQPELFTNLYDSNGNDIPIEALSKANELTGAGVEYLTSVADYIYTHYKKNINRDGTKYDELPYLEWDAFLEYASGGIAGQIERIERTVMQYVAKPKQVFMIDTDGHLHTRQPFVLDFDWGGPGKLDAKQAARLARLNKTNGNKAEKTNGLPRMPIRGITILAAKPLFEAFFKKDPSTYSFPVGMYAKIFYHSNTLKKQFLKIPKNTLAEHGTQLLDTDPHISAYVRYIRYIMRHNNLTAAQMKDKKYHRLIRYPVLEFLKSVYPSLIDINGRKERHPKISQFSCFLTNAQIICLEIEDFKLYPVLEGIEEGHDDPKVVFSLYTNRDNALEGMKQAAVRMNTRGTGKM